MAENVGMTYEQWLQQAKNNAAQTRDTAISNANINYQKSKSEYGNKAEALRNMGLTGAGYSDYLNGQAYAQMQGAVSNAYAQERQTNFDLDAKYMDYLEQKNAQRYALLDSLDAGGYTMNQLDRYLSQDLITPEEYEGYKTNLRTKAQNITGTDFAGYTREQGQAFITSLEKAGYQDEANKAKVAFNDHFNIKWNAGGMPAYVSNANGTNTYANGDKIKVTVNAIVDSNGATQQHEYKVKIKGKTDNVSVIEAAANAQNGQVFKYGTQLYVKIGDTVYELNKKDYEELDKWFK